jgi:hypothetical protein
MHSEYTQPRARSTEAGNTILEFAIVMVILIPMFAGAFTIGMALTKAIQVSNTTRDAAVLMVRSTTDAQSGLDLSQPQNQRIIVRAAQGLGMALNAQEDPNPNGSSVVILSKVVMVGPVECSNSQAGLTPNGSAPFWDTGNCPNYGSYAFEYRVVIGNGTTWSSTLGNPGATVQSDGTITPADIASNSSDRATSFASATGMTLLPSTFALVSEMYANVSYLNFFSVLSNPIIYARSIS